ncbi:MAG TPA: ATP-binding protein [Acidimicrobiales bacterium]
MTPDTAPPDASAGVVRLRVPADSRYARVVRVAVAAYAVRLGAPPQVVEDVRLAIDEALILVLAVLGAEDDTTHVTLVLALDHDAATDDLTVELRTETPPTEVAAGPDALARFHELIPAGVTVDVVEPQKGRVVLRRRATRSADRSTGT